MFSAVFQQYYLIMINFQCLTLIIIIKTQQKLLETLIFTTIFYFLARKPRK